MTSRKVFVMLGLVFLLVCSMASVSLAADICIVIDGKQVATDVAPVLEDNRTLVPVRVIAEGFGARVGWDGAKQEVKIKTAANDIVLTIGSKNVTVNGARKTLEVPAKIIGDRTMIPLRFVSDNLGAEINYDSSSRTVNVKYFSNMAGTLKIGGSTTVQPISEKIALELMKMNKGLSITTAGTGSGDGIKGAGEGRYHIGNSSRAIKEAEIKEYGLVEHQVGSDGIAVIVHPPNTVSGLTRQQVFDIYTGKIRNWKEVGGKNAPIFVQTREEGAGTLGAFVELAIQAIDKNAKITPTAAPHGSNGLVKQAVARGENNIGFISFGYIDSSVKALKIDGVEATAENALAGKFAYVRPLVVVTKGAPTPLAAKFIDYHTSPQGFKILEEENYLPMK